MLEWLFPTFTSCVVCGKEDTFSVELGVCKGCYDKLPWSDNPRCIFTYEEPIDVLIQDLKYNNKRYLADIFIKLGKQKLDRYNYDVISFVPGYSKSKRGYFQAECIAKSIDKTQVIDSLEKVKDVVSQTKLSTKERLENVKGAFKVKNIEKIKNIKILLVDDVFTTGATTLECQKVLLDAGARDVQVFTLCATASHVNG